MPCFKGLAVSIHTPDGPLPEHHIQRQSRTSRINAYIPVPPPKIVTSTRKPEPSTFAISITLLTPGLSVPYSTPKPTQEEPYPRPQIVGGFQGFGREKLASAINPYEPLTSSHNETIAAYIYFDGRHKEEVATLLRRGEETWVNSRWVSVPQSEGGGLAEREFLFREVGLERWLNGLDLEGKDAAATIEKRRRKMEKKRIKREMAENDSDEDGPAVWRKRYKDKSVLRYGENALEKVSDEENSDSSSEESDDDPIPEAAGQIKVALFRVLASGEIKKGEYEPQFGADEDDEDNKNGEDGDIDHTTSFAKPKTLDPKSISTQTVTGIDPSDRPYATFTFYYRGEKTLRKMGILKQKETVAVENAKPGPSKRASVQADIAKLKPLKPGGALGFTGIRGGNSPGHDSNKDDDDMDSDEGPATNVNDKIDDADEDVKSSLLSPEDARKQGEIADGVERIRLKRQHSVEPSLLDSPTSLVPGKTPKITEESSVNSEKGPVFLTSEVYDPAAKSSNADAAMIGSPLKRPRSSTSGIDQELRRTTAENLAKGLGFGYSPDSVKTEPTTKAESSFGGPIQPPIKEESGESSQPTVSIVKEMKEEDDL